MQWPQRRVSPALLGWGQETLQKEGVPKLSLEGRRNSLGKKTGRLSQAEAKRL